MTKTRKVSLLQIIFATFQIVSWLIFIVLTVTTYIDFTATSETDFIRYYFSKQLIAIITVGLIAQISSIVQITLGVIQLAEYTKNKSKKIVLSSGILGILTIVIWVVQFPISISLVILNIIIFLNKKNI